MAEGKKRRHKFCWFAFFDKGWYYPEGVLCLSTHQSVLALLSPCSIQMCFLGWKRVLAQKRSPWSRAGTMMDGLKPIIGPCGGCPCWPLWWRDPWAPFESVLGEILEADLPGTSGFWTTLGQTLLSVLLLDIEDFLGKTNQNTLLLLFFLYWKLMGGKSLDKTQMLCSLNQGAP